MNDDIKKTLRIIMESCKGRNNAITRRELKQRLGYNNDRQLRLTIAELRHEGLPILFATQSPAGYYTASNYNEIQEGIRAMRSYLIEEAKVIRDFKILGTRYLARNKQGTLL